MPPAPRRRRRARFSKPRRRSSGIASAVSNDTTLASTGASEPSPPPPFYGLHHTLHRVSPLFVGAHPLTSQRLAVLSKRIREVLVGDVVRGIVVGGDVGGIEDEVGVGALANAGQLERAEWRWVRVAEALGFEEPRDEEEDRGEEDGAGGGNGLRALQLVLQYEHLIGSAILLPDLRSRRAAEEGRDEEGAQLGPVTVRKWQVTPPRVSADDDDPLAADDDLPSINPAGRNGNGAFRHLPLLLLHVPAPLRPVIADFVASTFDCRVTDLRLGTATLVGAWEKWLVETGAPHLGTWARDAVVTLGFYMEGVQGREGEGGHLGKGSQQQSKEGEEEERKELGKVGVKAIEVVIPASDIQRFVMAGKDLLQLPDRTKEGWRGEPKQRWRLAGRRADEGWGWRQPQQQQQGQQQGLQRLAGLGSNEGGEAPPLQDQPFVEALAHYLSHHLALDLFHPAVRVTKMAAGGFTLAESGRVRINEPPRQVGEEEDDVVVGGTYHDAIWGLLESLVVKAQGGLGVRQR